MQALRRAYSDFATPRPLPNFTHGFLVATLPVTDLLDEAFQVNMVFALVGRQG